MLCCLSVDSIVYGDEVEVSHCRLLKVLFASCSLLKQMDEFLCFLYYIFII